MKLGLLAPTQGNAILRTSREVLDGKWDDHFVLDIFQTGSGTSTNMNANEVLAALATKYLGSKVHQNDHINMSQSSNDVIPTAIHLAAALGLRDSLLPALAALARSIAEKALQVGEQTRHSW